MDDLGVPLFLETPISLGAFTVISGKEAFGGILMLIHPMPAPPQEIAGLSEGLLRHHGGLHNPLIRPAISEGGGYVRGG